MGLNGPIKMTPWVTWTAFGVAFAPALLSVGRFVWVADVPIDRAPIVGGALLAWSVWRAPSTRSPGHRDGAVLLLVACLLELVGISGESWSIAHLSLPVGVVGLARLLGAPPLGSAALAFFAVPPPHFMTAPLSPGLEAAYATAGSALANALGLPVQASVSTLDGPAGGIDLMATDGGVALAHMLAGIGWFAGLGAHGLGAARGLSGGLLRRLVLAAIFGLSAFPIQLLAMLAASLATGAGAPEFALFVLRDAVWPLAAAAGVGIVVWRTGTAARRDASTLAIGQGDSNR